MSDSDFLDIVGSCETKQAIHDKLGVKVSGTYTRLINDKYKLLGAKLKPKKLKYKLINKTCPVCTKKFETSLGHPREKTVCSRACSNTYFRSGPNNPNWKESQYRSTCFLYHDKKCVYCGETNIVEVHHYDENKKNNLPKNLIPLCPTHHKYWHSRYRYIIVETVYNYRVDFIKSMEGKTDGSRLQHIN